MSVDAVCGYCRRSASFDSKSWHSVSSTIGLALVQLRLDNSASRRRHWSDKPLTKSSEYLTFTLCY